MGWKGELSSKVISRINAPEKAVIMYLVPAVSQPCGCSGQQYRPVPPISRLLSASEVTLGRAISVEWWDGRQIVLSWEWVRLGSRGSEDRALSRSLVRRAELEGHRREGFVVFCSDLFGMKESWTFIYRLMRESISSNGEIQRCPWTSSWEEQKVQGLSVNNSEEVSKILFSENFMNFT